MAVLLKDIPFVQPGEPILASYFNALSNAVIQIANFIDNTKGGGGLDVKVTNSGLLIALMGFRDRVFPVKLTAAPPAGVPILPSQCKYGYRGIGRDIEGTDVIPTYGRDVHGDECAVYPAEIDHLAAVFLNPQDDGSNLAELWILTECPARGPCQ